MVPAMGADDPDTPPTEAEASTSRRPRVRILLAFLAAFLLLLIIFREVLFPFLLAIYVAYLVEPIVRWATRSRLLGLKWTRGPTIVVIYVLVLGGMAVLGWVGITKLAKTVSTVSKDVSASLKEDGHRATFVLEKPAPAEDGAEPAPREKDILIPQGTKIRLPDGNHTTLYAVRLEPDEASAIVLLEHVGDRQSAAKGERGEFTDIAQVTYADGAPLTPAHRQALVVRGGGAATGLEYFAERKLISPIVRNLAGAGYDIEPDLVRDFVRLKADTLKEDLPERLGKGAVAMAGKLVLSIYMFFLILMLTAFIVMDRKGIASFFGALPPPRYQGAYQSLIGYIDDGLAGVIRGQLVICGVNGVLTYLGLLILGVPYALLLASVAAILSLIPVFGTIVSSIPIVLIGTTKGIDTGLLALGWIVLIHVLEANVLNPVIMGSHARMHPVIIIFALLAGEHSYGIWGALLAVPTASIIQSCFRFYLHEIEGIPQEPESPHGEWLGRVWRKVKGWFSKKKDAPAEGASS
jgi:predicted PurR-regulated permease PerM